MATSGFLFKKRQKRSERAAACSRSSNYVCSFFLPGRWLREKQVILSEYSENNRWSRKCAINIKITHFICLWKMSRSFLTRVCLGKKEKKLLSLLFPWCRTLLQSHFPPNSHPSLVLIQAGAHPQRRENTFHLKNSSSEYPFKRKFSPKLPNQHVGGVFQRRAKLQLPRERIRAVAGRVAPFTGR